MGDIAFEAPADPPRLRVADTVGNERYELRLESPVDPEPVSTEGFRYPVSDAVRVELSGFELRGFVRMHLWDAAGELLQVVDQNDDLEAPPGEYVLELCRPTKTYLRFSGAVRLETDREGVRVRFGERTAVEIGARSLRKQPAETVTTTAAPVDVMAALSCLGEGLLTTTPLRAFPTLRGYPPQIEVGDELDVPEAVASRERPLELLVQPDLEYLYEAAPLAYYLDAAVRPGREPRLLADGETIYEFDAERFAADVESLLRHVVTLDCVVRTAGPYPLESVECDRLAGELPSDLRELYSASQGTRLARYLEVPFEPVAVEAPDWPATGYVEPLAENVDAIPHLVAQLVPIRTADPERVTGAEARSAALAAFTDGGGSSTRASSKVFSGDASFVDVPAESGGPAIWVGSDIPISANKLVVEGFEHRHGRTETGDGSIDVTVVCNEAWMSGEATSVADHYSEREDLPFEVTTHDHLDRASLADLLEAGTDFLHYVGHATAAGLECSDGYLDVGTLGDVGVETFFLNACQSYRQAKRLVEAGAIGGIATLSDVTDDQASVIGRTVAKLLDMGYPLRVALEIARTRSVVGGQYLVVGDDGVTLVSTDGVPDALSVRSTESAYQLRITTYPSIRAGVGGLYVPWLDSPDEDYLLGGTIGPFELDAAELRAFLEYTNVPVEFDGEFRWAFDLAAELG